jgi:hypothetical protein
VRGTRTEMTLARLADARFRGLVCQSGPSKQAASAIAQAQGLSSMHGGLGHACDETQVCVIWQSTAHSASSPGTQQHAWMACACM